MEYEGKYKIIYIGTVVLAVLLFVLYGVYFIQQGQVKETTHNYNREVKSANEEGLGIVLGASAEEFSEIVEEEVLEEDEVEETKQEENIIPVKKNNKNKRVSNNKVTTPSKNETVDQAINEPIINNNSLNDEVIDTTVLEGEETPIE